MSETERMIDGQAAGARRAGLADAEQVRELRLQTARRGITERRRITQRLRQALAVGGFVLQYQPQVLLASGRLRGAEAMIRLRHRRRGLLLPGLFMPVAERADVIHDIGGWMLHTACMAALEWPERVCVAVRLSARQLQSGRLIKSLIEALHHSGLPAQRLELELTETMLIDDNDDVIFNLRALHGLGVRMAIDDFGIGYAALSALKRLPLSTLKLDRSLIRAVQCDDPADEAGDAAIIRAAIEAGHSLGCTVLADGVETAAQCRMLIGFGCDAGQGSFFGKPSGAAELPIG